MKHGHDESQSLDACLPHESAIDSLQQAWLRTNVSSGDRLLDLGCGCGRTLVPLARAGAICTGLDQESSVLDECRQSLEASRATAELVNAECIEWLGATDGTWDVVCCLGNTLCQFWQIDQAIELLVRIRRRLEPGGFLVIDDIPGDLWPELAQGNWQAGLDHEQGRQLVWSADDAVFAIRSSSKVDENDWDIGPDDEPLRALDSVPSAVGRANCGLFRSTCSEGIKCAGSEARWRITLASLMTTTLKRPIAADDRR